MDQVKKVSGMNLFDGVDSHLFREIVLIFGLIFHLKLCIGL